MSQLNDIAREFLKMKNRYNWNRVETVENMHNVLAACEWQLFTDDEIPKNSGGCDDFIKKHNMEREEIYRLLFNDIVEPNKMVRT